MIQIFFSYSREDSAVVDAIRQTVAAPLEVWIDHQALDTGQWFPERIEAAIKRECHFFAVFLSPHAAKSTWVRKEIGLALDREMLMRSALPFALRSDVPFVLPLSLRPALATAAIPEPLRQHNVFMPRRAASVVSEVGEKLRASILQFASDYLAHYQPTFEKAIVDSLASDLVVLQDRAFRLSACLRDPVEVLASDPEGERELTEAILAYNAFVVPLVRRLPDYALKIRATWGENLGAEAHRLARYVEETVYRGHVYALNKVTASIAEAQAKRLSAAKATRANETKARLLAEAHKSLNGLKLRCGRLVERLRREAR